MEPVQVKIHIDRVTAIESGQSQFGDTIVPVDPSQLSPEQRDELTKVYFYSTGSMGNAKAYSDLTKVTVREPGLPTTTIAERAMRPIGSPTIEAIGELLDHHRTVRVAEEQKHAAEQRKLEQEDEAQIAAYLERPLSDIVTTTNGQRYHAHEPQFRSRRYSNYDRWPAEYLAKTRAARKRAEELGDQAIQRGLDQVARQRRQEEEKAAQRKAAVAAWVAEHGTDSQRQRLARGLLPEAEILAAVRDYVFAPLVDYPRYERMTKESVLSGRRANQWAEVEFDTTDATGASEDEFRRLLEIEEAIRSTQIQATAELRVHAATLTGLEPDDEGETTERVEVTTVLVTVDWHGYSLSREYAA